MSVTCEKCGADISFESEGHANCDRVAELLAACEGLLNTTFVKDQFKYLDKGIGTNTGGGKAILAARAAIKKAKGL